MVGCVSEFASGEFVHGVVDAEKSGYCVNDGGGKQAQEQYAIHEARHEVAFFVAQYGGYYAPRGALAAHYGQQQGYAGFDAFEHSGIDEEGAYYACSDCAFQAAQFHPQRFVEAYGGEFSGAVVYKAAYADKSACGCYCNDLAAVPFQHGRKECFCCPEQGQYVYIEGSFDVFILNFQQGFCGNDSGIVYQDVYGAVLCDEFLCGAVYGFPLGNIADCGYEGVSFGGRFGFQRCKRCCVHVPHGGPCASAGKFKRHDPAYAGSAACYQDQFVFDVLHTAILVEVNG